MRMILERMRIANFKGCRALEISFSSGATHISGANGTGKTTLADAYCWVLFNQNAAGDAPGGDSFREKPLDDSGNPIHNVDTTVELFCTLDGQRFDLKRTQVETWVKKRGAVEPTFQGNVSTYWINGVETKQQEFRQRIGAIAGDDVFRLVGSLSAFNALDWKKRRLHLLNMAGSDVDADLLARDEYRPIADEIATRNISPDDLRKVLADRRKAIGQELQKLPVRIDEARKTMPQVQPGEIEESERALDALRGEVEAIEQQIADARTANGESANRGQVLALEQEVISAKRRLMDEHEANRRRLQAEADAAGENFRRLSAMLGDAKREVETRAARFDAAEKQVQALREQYMRLKRAQAEPVETTCPMCGQPLPDEKIESVRRAAEENRRAQLSAIQDRGRQAAEESARLKSALDDAAKTAEDLEARLQAAEAAREAANAAVRENPREPDYAADRALSGALERLEALRAKLAESPDEKVAALTERKRDVLAAIDKRLSVLGMRDIARETERRIAEHEARQRELGAQLSEVEIAIGLMERFTQDRCSALESSINRQFPTVRWRLFDTQINGGISETCVAMLDCEGAYVPYESANTARQIAADMEIVDALSRHYDVRVPLFIDNAERISALPSIDTQTITLSVSADGELKIKEA